MPESNTSRRRFSAWHWIRQIAPPTVILATPFATQNGAALIYFLGLFVIPVLVSFVSILLKVFDFRNRKYFLVRPVLTITFFAAIFGIAEWSYEVALHDATEAAARLQEQCASGGSCPPNPAGWTVEGSRIARRDLGLLFKYQATYAYEPYSFDIRVYRGPDIGHRVRGGTDAPVSVVLYEE